jgi:hypothetical protein
MHGESRNADKILFGKYEGRRPSGRICIERSIGRVFIFYFIRAMNSSLYSPSSEPQISHVNV